MEKTLKIAIDMYFNQVDTMHHRHLGENFLRSETMLDNLIAVVSHVREMEANNYEMLSYYNAAGKWNYLQHLYVVFIELCSFAYYELKEKINDLSDMFYRYHDKKTNNSDSSFSYEFQHLFNSYILNPNKTPNILPSVIAKSYKLCQNQAFSQVLNSFLKQANTLLLSYFELNLKDVRKNLEDAVKSNYAMSL